MPANPGAERRLTEAAPSISTALTALLACPGCAAPLDDLACPACGTHFPVHDGVPWLVADPVSAQQEWRNRWQAGLAELEARQRAAREALSPGSSAGLSAAARARLTNLAEGYAGQHRQLRMLLGSLALARPADLTTYQALRTRLPPSMGIAGYATNVFRDWCWGDDENRRALSSVSDALGVTTPGKLLVLGAGAGRLAYDLHRLRAGQGEAAAAQVPPGTGPLSVALELNPYLTTILSRLARGERLAQVEFPLAPRAGDRSAIERTLEAPAPASGAFHVVLADARRPPFRPGSFDAVVTPWLLDVIDAAPTALIGVVNRLLKPGGRWVYHGSLAFDRSDLVDSINLEELKTMAADLGFSVEHCAESRDPYLCCPDSRHGRVEEVLTLGADKEADAGAQEPGWSLPEWLVTGEEPVPLTPAFEQQAMATRIHAFVMSLIDGKRSLNDMAALMEAQRLMPKEDARAAIRGFLIRMFDEASAGGG
jgi:uncharacterized protein YbaR (Trm112 family)/SAM-dependent methyltransferase